ncbi:MAG: molybdopterin molybdotransferase MoeA [Candidatus Tectomicrobia bacterium]|nr:molybdopterin molybdotransferase MoeA [Candidatus Tectomicrobia bacterium]
MLRYQEALEHLLGAVAPLPTEQLPLMESIGRTLSADLVAPYPMPPYHQSLMDGYAVRSATTRRATVARPVRLTLGATLTAGETLADSVSSGQAVRIMTGAVIPDGVDTVVRLEDGEVDGDTLIVRQPLSRGQYVQRRGAEVRSRTVICPAGEVLTPQRIGMALALGLSTAEVVRTPRIALVAPGDELLPPGALLQPGKKWCSNLYALELRARELGGRSVNLGIVPDTLDALIAALQQGLSYDVVMILGASGRGEHDFAGRAMAAVGARSLFRGIAMAPGRSTAVAQCRQTLIFGLPGSPWATLVTFEALVAPALRAMLGQRPATPVWAVLTADVQVRRGLTHFIPVQLQVGEQGWRATPLRDLLSVAQAESNGCGWLRVPPHRRRLLQGARVRVHLV